MRIVRQELLPEGIRQTLENGEQRMIPYPRNEEGEEYADLFPADVETH